MWILETHNVPSPNKGGLGVLFSANSFASQRPAGLTSFSHECITMGAIFTVTDNPESERVLIRLNLPNTIIVSPELTRLPKPPQSQCFLY